MNKKIQEEMERRAKRKQELKVLEELLPTRSHRLKYKDSDMLPASEAIKVVSDALYYCQRDKSKGVAFPTCNKNQP